MKDGKSDVVNNASIPKIDPIIHKNGLCNLILITFISYYM